MKSAREKSPANKLANLAHLARRRLKRRRGTSKCAEDSVEASTLLARGARDLSLNLQVRLGFPT